MQVEVAIRKEGNSRARAMSITTRLTLPWLAVSRRAPPLHGMAERRVGRACSPRVPWPGWASVVTMVLLQLGFLEAAVRARPRASYDQFDFDVVLISPRYEQLYDAGTFPAEPPATGRGPGRRSWTPGRSTSLSRCGRCPPSPLVPERDGHQAPGVRQTPVPPVSAGVRAPCSGQVSCWRSVSTWRSNPFRDPILRLG